MDLPAHRFLEDHGVAHQRLVFPLHTEKHAANVPRAMGCNESQMVKTLIFRTGTEKHALVMLGGDKSAVSGRLKKALGSRDIKLADPASVKQITGYEIGSIPPFHWQPAGFRSFLDACLMDKGVVGVGAGVWGQEIMITPSDLVEAAEAEAIDLSGADRS